MLCQVVDSAPVAEQKAPEKPKPQPVTQSREELPGLPVRELNGMLQERRPPSLGPWGGR